VISGSAERHSSFPAPARRDGDLAHHAFTALQVPVDCTAFSSRAPQRVPPGDMDPRCA
jgi:hypothetical protein